MTKLFLALAIIFLFMGQAQASMKEDVKEGNILYNKSKYAEAAKAYEEALSKDAKNGIASFGLGTAQYKEGSYLGAIEKFNTAIASGHPKLVQASDYNIGNIEYRIGNLKEGGSFDEAKERYETALKFYKRAMDLNPHDRDAKFNYEFVEKKLNELARKYQLKKDETKKENKKDEKKDKNQEQNKQQKNEDKDQSGGGGQSQKEKQDQSSQAQPKEAEKGEKGEEGKDKGGEGQARGGQQKEEPQSKPEEQNKGQGSQQQPEEKEKSSEQKTGEDNGKEEQSQKGQDKGKEGEEEEGKSGGGLEAYQSPAEQEGREMTEQEAKMLLEGYKGEEATGGAVRMRKRVIDLPEPAKDW